MKAAVRSTMMTILVLIGIFSISASAQAYFSADQASEQSPAYVLSGGYSYDGDIIAKILPVSRSPIVVWKAEQYDTNNKIPVDYPIQFLGWEGGHWFDEYKYDHDHGHWMPEEHGHNRHWVKSDGDPAPTPIPSAALLLGSGLSIMGGLRASWRKRKDPKVRVQEVLV